MKIASDIKTELWNTVIADLQEEGWRITKKYNGFDAGIDFDALTLEKDELKIDFAWDNWREGEIICESAISESLKQKYPLVFRDHNAN